MIDKVGRFQSCLIMTSEPEQYSILVVASQSLGWGIGREKCGACVSKSLYEGLLIFLSVASKFTTVIKMHTQEILEQTRAM